ncbi:MAG: potassium/proton antiporter, partial [Rhodospirillales bacterium]|nr:potassium/proton antiporter [Rhodospirillales bacterium]
MDLVNETILVGAGLIVASIFSSLLAFRMGAPLLLVFLMVGLLGGAAGAGGLMGGDAQGAFVIGSIALAIILFDSG